MVSVQYSEAQNAIHSHFHDGYQLIYVVRGEATVSVSGREYPAKAGTLVLISRLESHELRSQTRDYSRYTVLIDPEVTHYSGLLGEQLFSLLVNRPEQFHHAMDLTAEPRVRQLLEQMTAETDGPMKDQMLLFLLGQLLVLCCRAYPEQVPENTRELELIQRIQRYIEQNMAQRLTLAVLSEQFHMSQSYLSHLFKDIAGCSVIGYLTACRLQLAKSRLAQTDWEVSRIVETCGFSDNSNFSRTFKKTTGMSPSEFRKQYQK